MLVTPVHDEDIRKEQDRLMNWDGLAIFP